MTRWVGCFRYSLRETNAHPITNARGARAITKPTGPSVSIITRTLPICQSSNLTHYSCGELLQPGTTNTTRVLTPSRTPEPRPAVTLGLCQYYI